MKKIAIFSAARSDFGILKNIILKLEKDKRFDLDLIVNSAHLSSKFGETIKEINEINVKNKIILKFKYKGSKPQNIINYYSNITQEISNYINKHKPKAIIIMGDRYEMFGCAFSCLQHQVKIIHLCGGSITLGSHDDIYRDSISRMANLHLVETIHHKNRLKNIGIKDTIKIVGAPALENIKTLKKIQFSEIVKKLSLTIYKKEELITACFHPETTISLKNNIKNLKILLTFLQKRNENIILTYPNADHGFENYIKIINKFCLKKKNLNVVKSLGVQNYYSILKESKFLIGNSSSGIIESASFKLPTINLGNRQKYRITNKNVIHSLFELNQIEKNYKKIINKNFNQKMKKINNIYYKKNCSSDCVNSIVKFLSA